MTRSVSDIALLTPVEDASVQGERIPPVCRDSDMIRLLGVSPSTYAKWKSAGTFNGLVLTRPGGLPIPGATFYSGHKVAKWLRGELTPPGTSRFFDSINAARRRKIAKEDREATLREQRALREQGEG